MTHEGSAVSSTGLQLLSGLYLPQPDEPQSQRKVGRMCAASGFIADVEEPAGWGDGAAATAAIAGAPVIKAIHWESAAGPKPILGAPHWSHVQLVVFVLQRGGSLEQKQCEST